MGTTASRASRKAWLAGVGTVAAITLLTGGLSGCGSTDAGGQTEQTASDPAPIPDLTGVWDEADPAFGLAHQAIVTGSTITIYWLDGDDKMLYWAGSFEPPAAAGAHEWTSANDTSQTSSAMLASSDATKAFAFDDGVISYETSALGQTSTIRLEQSSSTVPAGIKAAVPTAPTGHAEVVESGMGVDGDYAWVSAMVQHEGLTGEFATVLFNVFDANDILIASEEQVESFGTVGTTFPIGTQVKIPEGMTAARVEATVSVSDHGASEPMPVVDPIEAAAPDPRFQISNSTGDDWQDPRISIVCRDAGGAIVGGGISFPKMIPAGGQFLVSDAHLIVSETVATCSAYVQLQQPM